MTHYTSCDKHAKAALAGWGCNRAWRLLGDRTTASPSSPYPTPTSSNSGSSLAFRGLFIHRSPSSSFKPIQAAAPSLRSPLLSSPAVPGLLIAANGMDVLHRANAPLV